MFSTFTTAHGGTLIIRTQDMRRLEDAPGETILTYWLEDHLEFVPIVGTAQENLDRLKAEELAAIAATQQFQQRQQNNLPILPIKRGRA